MRLRAGSGRPAASGGGGLNRSRAPRLLVIDSTFVTIETHHTSTKIYLHTKNIAVSIPITRAFLADFWNKGVVMRYL